MGEGPKTGRQQQAFALRPIGGRDQQQRGTVLQGVRNSRAACASARDFLSPSVFLGAVGFRSGPQSGSICKRMTPSSVYCDCVDCVCVYCVCVYCVCVDCVVSGRTRLFPRRECSLAVRGPCLPW
jgi:hypothetical protein